MQKTRVLVVGGGLVGMSLAVALARSGVAVTVADREPPATRLASVYDGRAAAIAYAGVQLLRATGIWEHVKESQPIRDIRVTDAESLLFLGFDHRDLGGEPFGNMVENRHLRYAQAKAAAEANVTQVTGAISRLEVRSGCIRAVLDDETEISTELLVAADGVYSTVRNLAGISTRGWNYDQVGMVLTICHERPHSGIAHERFFPNGPFAILPLPGNRSSLVWTERTTMAQAVLALSEARFHEELQAKLGTFLGDITPEGRRWSYPLALHHADHYIGKRLALVGDAAHRIHPIAGQGLNLGLRDAAALAEVIVDASRLGLDIGAASVLARYQRWRRFDSVLLLSVTDLLNRLFSNRLPPVRIARDAGLAAVHHIKPLKQQFVNYARGTAGTLPQLLTGKPL